MKLAFTVLAAGASVPLALTMEVLLMQHRIFSPGAMVWVWLHPDPRSASPGSSLGAMLAIDSSCWFVVLMAAAFMIDRVAKGKKRNDSINTAGK